MWIFDFFCFGWLSLPILSLAIFSKLSYVTSHEGPSTRALLLLVVYFSAFLAEVMSFRRSLVESEKKLNGDDVTCLMDNYSSRKFRSTSKTHQDLVDKVNSKLNRN
jgi:hypothetical protein